MKKENRYQYKVTIGDKESIGQGNNKKEAKKQAYTMMLMKIAPQVYKDRCAQITTEKQKKVD